MQLFGRGLRRRLPPMVGGDQRRIRLAYSLVLAARHAGPVLRRGDRHGREPRHRGPPVRARPDAVDGRGQRRLLHGGEAPAGPPAPHRAWGPEHVTPPTSARTPARSGPSCARWSGASGDAPARLVVVRCSPTTPRRCSRTCAGATGEHAGRAQPGADSVTVRPRLGPSDEDQVLHDTLGDGADVEVGRGGEVELLLGPYRVAGCACWPGEPHTLGRAFVSGSRHRGAAARRARTRGVPTRRVQPGASVTASQAWRSAVAE